MPTPNASVVVKIGALMDATVGSVFGKTTSGLKKIGDTMKELASRSQELKRLNAATVRLSESVEALKVRYDKQSATLAKAEASFAKVKEKTAAAGSADEKLAAQLTRADEAVTRARANLDRTNLSLTKAKTDYREASAAAEKFRAVNQHVEASLDHLGAAMKRYEGASAARQKNQARRAQWRAAMVEVGILGAAVKRVFDKASESEDAKIRLGFVLRGDKHQIGGVIRETRAFVHESSATMPEMLAIQGALNREGLQAEEALLASKTVHMVSRVTQQDAAETAKAIAGIYNTAGLQMVGSTQEKLSRIGDLAAALQQNFAIEDIGGLGSGLAKALPQATMARVSFEQTSAAIGALTRYGIDAGSAGQQMSAVLRNLTKASQALGFQLVHDAKGNLGFEGTILSMNARLNRMGGLERNRDALTKAFTRRGADAAFYLSRAAATGELVQAQESLAGSMGRVRKEYEKLEASPKERWEKAVKNIGMIFNPIGLAMMPAATAALEKVEGVFTQLGKFFEKHPTAAKWIGGLSVAALGLGGAITIVGYAMTTILTPFLKLKELTLLWKLRSLETTIQLGAQTVATGEAAIATDGLAVSETEEVIAARAANGAMVTRIGLLGRLKGALLGIGDVLAGSALLSGLLVGGLGAATGAAIAYDQQQEFQAATDERMRRWSGTHIVLNHGTPSPGAAMEAAQLPGGHAVSMAKLAALHTGLEGMIQIGQPKKMAKGGIATKPTLVEVGDAGTEGIVPLPRNFRQGLGSTTITVHAPITVHGVTEPRAVALQVRAELERAVREAEARRRGGMHD
jgi:TP901 family phage tail tape measure protein